MNVRGSMEHLTTRPHTKIQPAVSPLVSVFPEYRFTNNRDNAGLSHNIYVMNVLVKVTEYKGSATPDKWGKMPVFVQPIAGNYPRSLIVMSGSSAEMHEIEPEHTYLVSVNDTSRRREYTTHDGKRGVSKEWTFTKLGEVNNVVELQQLTDMVGDSNIVNDVLIGDEIVAAQEVPAEEAVN